MPYGDPGAYSRRTWLDRIFGLPDRTVRPDLSSNLNLGGPSSMGLGLGAAFQAQPVSGFDQQPLGFDEGVIDADIEERGARRDAKKGMGKTIGGLLPHLAQMLVADTSGQLVGALSEAAGQMERQQLMIEERRQREQQRAHEVYRDMLGDEAASKMQEDNQEFEKLMTATKMQHETNLFDAGQAADESRFSRNLATQRDMFDRGEENEMSRFSLGLEADNARFSVAERNANTRHAQQLLSARLDEAAVGAEAAGLPPGSFEQIMAAAQGRFDDPGLVRLSGLGRAALSSQSTNPEDALAKRLDLFFRGYGLTKEMDMLPRGDDGQPITPFDLMPPDLLNYMQTGSTMEEQLGGGLVGPPPPVTPQQKAEDDAEITATFAARPSADLSSAAFEMLTDLGRSPEEVRKVLGAAMPPGLTPIRQRERLRAIENGIEQWRRTNTPQPAMPGLRSGEPGFTAF